MNPMGRFVGRHVICSAAGLIVFGAGEWVGIVLAVIFIVFGMLSQMAGKWQEAQKEAARRARMNRPGPVPRRADPLEDEIAEFLRRAAERQKPGQGERPAPARAPSPPPVPSPPPALSPPSIFDETARPFRPPPLRPAPPPVEVEVAVAQAVEPESVAEHVEERFSRPQFGRIGSAGLGQEVVQSDEKLVERLREKFGRRVSSLAAVPGETAAAMTVAEAALPADRLAAPPAVDAAAMAALLTNPTTVRQAILVSEILHRPEERWR